MTSPAPPVSAVQARVGRRYGDRYQIRRLIGRGGMGAVYVAFDEILDQEVALKFLLAQGAADSADVLALRGEVQLAQRVTHENVCRTYDLEQIDGQFVVKMEYVAGETLGERLRRLGRLPVEETLAIARQIAAALGASHAQGVVHRDLKPENILVESATGRVVLMDFGIADAFRAVGDQSPTTKGTPAYMAPEQLRRQPVDGRADLYALGCTLYELLTGEPPFTGDSAVKVALRQVNAPPPDPRQRCPELPSWIAALIGRLLQKDPAQRFADAAELLVALQGPPPLPPPVVPRARRDLRLAAAGGLLLLCGGLVYGLLRRHPSVQQSWRPAIAVLLPEYDENANAPVLSPDDQFLAYTSDRDGSYRLYMEPAAGGKARALTPAGLYVAHASWAPDGRSVYVINRNLLLRVPLAGRPIETVADNTMRAVACGSQLIIEHYGTPDCPRCGQLVVRDVHAQAPNRGAERLLLQLEQGRYIYDMRCDHAGRQLTYVIGDREFSSGWLGDLWILTLDGGAPRRLLSDGNNCSPIFAADDRSIIFSARRGDSFGLWELATNALGGAPRPLTLGELPNLPGDVSADGKRLYFTNDFTTMQLYATPRGGMRRKIPHSATTFERIRVAPNGKEVLAIAVHDDKKDLVAYAIDDGSQRGLVERVESFALTPDGREVVYASGAGARWLLAALALAGGTPRHIAEIEPKTEVLSVAPDGFVYLSRTRDVPPRAARVPLQGGQVSSDGGLAAWAEVVPAPAGGWRFTVRKRMSKDTEYSLIAPGRPLDDPAATILVAEAVTWTPEGRALLVWDGHELRRYAAEPGLWEPVFPLQEAVGGISVSPDGQTVYTGERLGRVHRRVITNFDERPRLGGGDEAKLGTPSH